LKIKIEARGGRVTTSVSEKTTMLVVKELPEPDVITGKITEARERNIPIISKDDFIHSYLTLHVTKPAKR
jgi:NAD-dependent DNA ligase